MAIAHVPGILLTIGSYYGTLAAARSLGRAGIPVILADADPVVPTRFSRYVSRVIKAPQPTDLDAFGIWLLDYGKKNPGLVLYPTSDDLVWVIARYQDQLKEYYRIYQPPEQAMYKLLNKRHLYQIALEMGIEVPETHFPTSYQELDALAKKIEYPVLVKPRTQTGMLVNVKGLVAKSPAELRPQVNQFLDRYTYCSSVLQYDKALAWPMVQKFYPEASSETYSLTGFITEDSNVMPVRGAQKVLQYPISVGVGLAFENRPVLLELQEKVRNIASRMRYYGAFEVEFIHVEREGRYLLIDFNPRFYNQMGFEIHRGLRIPELVYAASVGDQERLTALLQHADENHKNSLQKWRFHKRLRFFLTTQWLGRNLSRTAWQRWLSWSRDPHAFDPVEDASDPLPLVAERMRMLIQLARHPRSTLRYYFR